MNKHELLNIIPQEQQDRVFSADSVCDINYEFLGFTDIYKHLSLIIPHHFIVVDLGCGYNAQCFYFSEHKSYIAVDISDCEKFTNSNCYIFISTIEDFIANNLDQFNLDETFAICSYVPPWYGNNIEIVKKAFKNVFTFYPHGHPEKPKLQKPIR